MKTRLVKTPPSADAQFAVIQEEIAKALEPVGKQHVDQRAELVKEWRNRPIWEWKIGVGAKQIRLDVVLKNAGQRLKDKKGQFQKGTIKDLIEWVFKTGTRAHKIVAKKAKALAFPFMGLNPAFFKSVDHPGTTARPDIDKINKRLNPFYDKQVRRGFANGFKRLNRKQ